MDMSMPYYRLPTEARSGIRFTDWMERKLGTSRWCVAHNLGSKLIMKYDLAISQKRYRELEKEYVDMAWCPRLAK